MSLISDLSELDAFTLVEFTTPLEVFRFTDAEDVLTTSAGTFDISAPEMAVRLPPNSGFLKEETAEIDLPFQPGGFTDHFSSQRRYPPTRVKIWEWFFDGNRGERALYFHGHATAGIRNRRGTGSTVTIEAMGLKMRYKVPLGTIVDAACMNVWGGEGCFKSFFGLTENVGIDLVDQTRIRTRPLARNYTNKRHFISGTFVVGGLEMKIRSWDPAVDPREFEMSEIVPDRWRAQVALIKPGCDFSYEQCKFWNNTPQFNGVGFGIPEYNPEIELR